MTRTRSKNTETEKVEVKEEQEVVSAEEQQPETETPETEAVEGEVESDSTEDQKAEEKPEEVVAADPQDFVVPEGYVLVPKEPTRQMIMQGARFAGGSSRATYKVMIDQFLKDAEKSAK